MGALQYQKFNEEKFEKIRILYQDISLYNKILKKTKFQLIIV